MNSKKQTSDPGEGASASGSDDKKEADSQLHGGSAAEPSVNQVKRSHQWPIFTITDEEKLQTYLEKVKMEFKDNPHAYDNFVRMLEDCRYESTRVDRVMWGVLNLFYNRGDYDLILEFNQFLPPDYKFICESSLESYFCNITVPAQYGMTFLHDVEETLQHQPEKFQKFKALMDHGFHKTCGFYSINLHDYFWLRMQLMGHADLLSRFDFIVSKSVKRSIAAVKQEFAGAPYVDIFAQKRRKLSTFQDVPFANAGKYAALDDNAFFDKVYQHLQNPIVYDNLMKCINLFNEHKISSERLVPLIHTFLSHEPNLYQWLKSYICDEFNRPLKVHASMRGLTVGENINEQFITCNRVGASYCAVSRKAVQPKCSGRTALCKEVLNDHWVSFPSWSEESTFVTSKKTLYEEYVFREEEEMYELDVVIETNSSLIKVLENLQKKMSKMSVEELDKFTVDDYLGATSPCLNQRAVWRLYGDGEVDVVMQKLKTQPVTSVPVVLKRAKAKDEEWRKGQKNFNEIWRKRNKKFYLRSLDQQGIIFKQNDYRKLGLGVLFYEIECFSIHRYNKKKPCMPLIYKYKTVLDDANDLLLYFVDQSTNINREDKQQMKLILQQFIPDLFHRPRRESTENSTSQSSGALNDFKQSSDEYHKASERFLSSYTRDAYTLFIATSTWYFFLRYHQILCDRLCKIFDKTIFVKQEHLDWRGKSESFQPKNEHSMDVDHYQVFLKLIRELLDGDIDADQYEDALRELIGLNAYILFTLDTVVSKAVRQLQAMVSEEVNKKCMEIYTEAAKKGATGGRWVTAFSRNAREEAYQRRAEAALAEPTDGNCFKIFFYKRECKVTIEWLDIDLESYAGRQGRRNIDARNKNRNPEEDGGPKPVFLPRNLRQCKTEKTSSEQSESLPSLQQEPIDDASKMESLNGDSECSPNVNTHLTVYDVDNEYYLYKRNALFKAKQSHQKLSLRLTDKFKSWHDQWLTNHVDQEQTEIATDWLRGRFFDTGANYTVVYSNNNISKPPYRSYCRYRVKKMDDYNDDIDEDDDEDNEDQDDDENQDDNEDQDDDNDENEDDVSEDENDYENEDDDNEDDDDDDDDVEDDDNDDVEDDDDDDVHLVEDDDNDVYMVEDDDNDVHMVEDDDVVEVHDVPLDDVVLLVGDDDAQS